MLDFIVRGLATWRIANLIVNEFGPGDILLSIREKTGIEYGIDGEPSVWPSWNPLHCVWCTSVWVAPIVYFIPKIISYIAALSAIGCILDSLTDLMDSRE